jgi:hypothetical protein
MNDYTIVITGKDINLEATVQDESVRLILKELDNVFSKKIIQHKEQRSIFDFNKKE